MIKKYTQMSALVVFTLWASTIAQADVSPTFEAQSDYGPGMSKKLGRGISNVAFGWVDILKGVEDVGQEQNILAAMTWGPIYGTGKAIGRTAAGVFEVATFPIPINDFEPIVEPEFVIETDH